MKSNVKVLVIDDEPQIRRALRVGLEKNDYRVILAENGESGLLQAAAQAPDLVILDVAMPPGIDGFEVCRRLREWSKVPIIFLSVRENEDDKVRALEMGADDYVTKPFGIRELEARIKAVVRRTSLEQSNVEQASFACGTLFIDFQKRLVTVRNEEVHLTPKEYDLLTYMVSNADRVLTHRQLLSKVWGGEFVQDHHTLRVHVANLRNKIEEQPERPRFIHTETRVGYRFRTAELN
ncbi:MAG: response regulator transcription factor [Candidatus Obscuribacterales bacterium]|nr:response regulator transcription factor [Candidatus Obscuribacterales bacterium]